MKFLQLYFPKTKGATWTGNNCSSDTSQTTTRPSSPRETEEKAVFIMRLLILGFYCWQGVLSLAWWKNQKVPVYMFLSKKWHQVPEVAFQNVAQNLMKQKYISQMNQKIRNTRLTLIPTESQQKSPQHRIRSLKDLNAQPCQLFLSEVGMSPPSEAGRKQLTYLLSEITQ